jgi:hypothetical protein
MDDYFIIMGTEYAINPYEILGTSFNSSRIGTNVFEVDLFNSSNYAKIDVSQVTNPFDIYFPLADNYNLTLFS